MSAGLAGPAVSAEQAYVLLSGTDDPAQVARMAGLWGMTADELRELALSYTPPTAELLTEACELLLLDPAHALSAFLYEAGDPPAYVFVGPAGRAQVTAKQLLEFRYARSALLTATGMVVPQRTRQQWDRVVTLLVRAQTEVTLSAEETRSGRAEDWVRLHLEKRPPVDDRDDAAVTDYPWRDASGAVHVFGGAVRNTVLYERQQRVDDREFGQMMRAAGCTPVRVNVTQDGRHTTRSAWRLPDGLAY